MARSSSIARCVLLGTCVVLLLLAVLPAPADASGHESHPRDLISTTSSSSSSSSGTAGLTPVEVARRLNLTRQPLGNYLRATWESEVSVPTSVLPPRFRSGSSHARLLSSAIYNLFAGHECVVPLHRLAADEVWHAYGLGNACITVAQFDVATGTVSTVRVGSDLLGGCTPQFTAKHEVWLGAYFADDLNEPWLLTGAQLAPGFDPADAVPANRTDFVRLFPRYRDLVIKLTPGQQ